MDRSLTLAILSLVVASLVISVEAEVTWLNPSDGQNFPLGQSIQASWSSDSPVVSPSFRLCSSKESCGTAIWPTITKDDSGNSRISLTAPPMDSDTPFFLTMRGDDMVTYESPSFVLLAGAEPTTLDEPVPEETAEDDPSSTDTEDPIDTSTPALPETTDPFGEPIEPLPTSSSDASDLLLLPSSISTLSSQSPPHLHFHSHIFSHRHLPPFSSTGSSRQIRRRFLSSQQTQREGRRISPPRSRPHLPRSSHLPPSTETNRTSSRRCRTSHLGSREGRRISEGEVSLDVERREERVRRARRVELWSGCSRNLGQGLPQHSSRQPRRRLPPGRLHFTSSTRLQGRPRSISVRQHDSSTRNSSHSTTLLERLPHSLLPTSQRTQKRHLLSFYLSELQLHSRLPSQPTIPLLLPLARGSGHPLVPLVAHSLHSLALATLPPSASWSPRASRDGSRPRTESRRKVHARSRWERETRANGVELDLLGRGRAGWEGDSSTKGLREEGERHGIEEEGPAG